MSKKVDILMEMLDGVYCFTCKYSKKGTYPTCSACRMNYKDWKLGEEYAKLIIEQLDEADKEVANE
jgi:hypothetical protein